MRSLAIVLVCAAAGGCTSESRYLINANLIPLIEAPPPLAKRTSRHRREIGPMEVDVRCYSPGSAELPALYQGWVNGPAGVWQFSANGPARADGDCNSPGALDEAAEHFALRYRKTRGAVPATRESGEYVFVSQRALRLDTRKPAPGGQVEVRARALNYAYLTASVLAGWGLGNSVGGSVLLARTSDSCFGNSLGCAADGKTELTAGIGLLILGSLSLVTALLTQIIGTTRESAEVAPLLPDYYYYEPPR
jgi:hypothetical protein